MVLAVSGMHRQVLRVYIPKPDGRHEWITRRTSLTPCTRRVPHLGEFAVFTVLPVLMKSISYVLSVGVRIPTPSTFTSNPEKSYRWASSIQVGPPQPIDEFRKIQEERGTHRGTQ